MKTYRLYHRKQKEFRDIEAVSATEACLSYGWMIADVWVRELTPIVKDLTSESGHRGGGWKTVTERR